MKYLLVTFSFLFILFGSSCAQNEQLTKEIPYSQDIVQPKGKATIVGSIASNVSRKGSSAIFMDETKHYTNITLTQIPTGKTQVISSDGNQRTYLLNLDPGLYAISQWNYNAFKYPHSYYFKDKIDSLQFELKEGDYIYLGRFNFEITTGRNISGLPIPTDVKVFVVDNKERDIANIKSKFFKFPLGKTATNLIRLDSDIPYNPKKIKP